MAVFTITSATSIFSVGTVGFQDGSGAADALTVQNGAHVIASEGMLPGSGDNAIWLKGPGAWTTTINGNVLSTHKTGLLLESGLPLSTIGIGVNGSITGAFAAIEARSAVTITNRGQLNLTGTDSGSAALRFSGSDVHRLTNYGTIYTDYTTAFTTAILDVGDAGTEIIDNRGSICGSILLGGGNDRVVNSGNMSTYIDFGSGDDRLSNSGTIFGEIKFGAGDNSFSNSGNTYGYANYRFGDGDDTILNSGKFIYSGSGGIGLEEIDFGNGSNAFTNTAGGSNFQRVIFGFGNDVFENAGIQENLVDLGAGNNSFINSGTFTGLSIIGGNGSDVVSNSGTIAYTFPEFAFTDIALGNGKNTFKNAGDVVASFTGGSGVDTFTNTGTFGGDVTLLDGADVFINRGSFTGIVSLNGDDLALRKFTNSGTLTGNVNMGDGDDIVINTGTINGGFSMFGGVNRFTNSGVLNGSYVGAATSVVASNIVYNFVMDGTVRISGTITGDIFLSRGNDEFHGGDNAETVFDSLGSDRYEFGGGDDVYGARFYIQGTPDARDYADGGNGSDTVRIDDNGTGAGQNIINLDTVTHRYGAGFADPAGGLSAGNRVTSGGIFFERIFSFENAIGSGVGDIIYGSAAANHIQGGEGSDVLHGYAGNDILEGGAGIDVLAGGRGHDMLTGGGEADYFAFISVNDSLIGASRDVIIDFDPAGGDLITLNAIDANTTNAAGTNDTFTAFIGVNEAFGANAPGTLRAVLTFSGWIIEGNTDNDRAPEFQIGIADATHSIEWSLSLFGA